MQKSWRRFAALCAAVVGCSTYSTSADIIGFSGFGPVNISGPAQNSISINGSTFELTDGQSNEAVQRLGYNTPVNHRLHRQLFLSSHRQQLLARRWIDHRVPESSHRRHHHARRSR